MTDKTQSSWQQQNIKNTKRLAYWTLAWLITMALANFGPHLIWSDNDTLTLVMIVVNVLFGGGMIWANKVQLMGLDELQQKIQLEAMGLSLGVGLVLGLAYSNLDVTNLIGSDAEISHLVMLMGVTYLIGTFLGVRKYQ